MEDTTDPLMQHKRSLWRGALISPWVVPVGLALFLGAFALVGRLVGADEHPPPLPGVVAGLFVLIILFGVPFTYLVTFVCVVPVALLLRARQALSTARLCLWCALMGPVTMYAYARLMNGQPDKVLAPLGIAMAASYGLISGAAFCWASGIRLFAGQRHLQRVRAGR